MQLLFKALRPHAYLGTSDGAKRGELFAQTFVVNAIIQVLHIEINTLQI